MAMTKQERADRKTEITRRKERMEAQRAITRAALSTNTCPECGGGLHRNIALTGWVQCDGLGAEGFRKNPNAKPCNWQGFTGE